MNIGADTISTGTQFTLVWSIGELIDAAFADNILEGSGPEFPQSLDLSDTIQSFRHHGQFKGRFTVIKGGRTD